MDCNVGREGLLPRQLVVLCYKKPPRIRAKVSGSWSSAKAGWLPF
jgi:hypothetical protein